MRFAVNLGDLIDGKNVALGQTDVALERVLAPIEAFQDAIGPVHHCVGNHEMYNFTREQYIHKLLYHTTSPHTQSPHSLPPPTTDVAYYSFIDPAAPSIEFIVLDSYGRSVLGSPAGSSDHISSIQLEGADQRFVQYNGAIDDVQMTWLKGILDAASAERRQVVVFAHVPVHEAASGNHPAAVLQNKWIMHVLIADVQYADDDDGWNYRKTSRRYYRHGLQVLRWATADWIDEAAITPRCMRFAVDLGDVIDGKNEPVGASYSALRAATAIFDEFQHAVGPVHHCVGNHELYNFSKATYVKEVTLHTQSRHADDASIPPRATAVAYYTFTEPSLPSYLFVVLDPYGQSTIGSPVDSPEYANAVEVGGSFPVVYVAGMHRLNENCVVGARPRLHQLYPFDCFTWGMAVRNVRNNPNENKNSSLGMPRDESLRCTEFNGAVDDTQLAWLANVLATAVANKQNVVLFTHVPIHPDTCRPGGVLLWNYAKVTALLDGHASSVRAVFSGHSHRNGYAEDHGIHYMVFHAALECPPTDNDAENRAYATVDVYENGLHVRGAGVIPSKTISW
ncbi:hypothetical protein DYB32_003885 [Aphanomyces invadans]|uniref:Calcineurin-like phosphoesterase domain-containing protein n=1 Tax=Aphanomyces invadans TaxID=157072 RepID=A0A418AZC5_9STRA|nr:hypothetical protein DYB32_003885 [Aphanomyces invadans]